MEVTNEEIMDMRERFKELVTEKETISLQVRQGMKQGCILREVDFGN